MYSLFWYLLTFLMKKITTAENIHPQRREVVVSGNEDCFYRALALWRVKQAMRSIRRSVSRVPVCFRKIRRISSCYSAIFNFFNAKFSRVIFLGWSNWLIMVVYCYCQIPSNASDGIASWRLVLWEVFFPRSCIIWIFQTKRDAYYLTDYFKKQAVPRLQTRC